MKCVNPLTFDVAQHGFRHRASPRPRIAKPQRRENVDRRRFRSAVVYRDPDQDIFSGRFGVLDEHVEVTVLVEYSRVEQLVLHLVASPTSIRLDEVVRTEMAPAGTCRDIFMYEWVGVPST